MCGICGSISVSGAPVDPRAIRPMLDAMVHRGPDGEGTIAEAGIAAGARRLAVIDVAGGHQPVADETGDVQVVFNGEIYNHRELRDELIARGHRFLTRSDTEVLVHLWQEHGPDLVARLDGMFAFCIHDRRAKETFLARDRIGEKPLYWRRDGDRLAFASETAVLLRHPGLPAEVDTDALSELLCLQFVPGDRTVWRGVRALAPGHAILVRRGEVATWRWYEIPWPDPRPRPLAEAAVELRDLLAGSVRLRRIADVPLGVFLSGGLDSAVVTALLAEHGDGPVRTFSIGFEDAGVLDERVHARAVAEAFATEHHEHVVSAVGIAEHLPRLVEHLREPVTDPALIPTWILSGFARPAVTVALSGEGGDELFAGYRRYALQQRYGWLGRLPGADRAGARLDGLLPRRARQALAAAARLDPAANHVEWSAAIGTHAAAALLEPEALDAYRRRTHAFFAPLFRRDRPTLAEQLRADQHAWLPGNLLAKVDRASMAASLEVRVPFLDHRIVEWAATLPDDQRLAGGTTKVVLREAFRDRLPRAILARPKRGFDLPLAAWLRGPLRSRVEALARGGGLEHWPGLRRDGVRRMIDLHLAGRQDYGLPLFNLLSIGTFLERFAA